MFSGFTKITSHVDLNIFFNFADVTIRGTGDAQNARKLYKHKNQILQ